jgi:hypothetical protein
MRPNQAFQARVCPLSGEGLFLLPVTTVSLMNLSFLCFLVFVFEYSRVS